MMQVVKPRNKASLAPMIGTAVIVSVLMPLGVFWDWTIAFWLVTPAVIGGTLLYLALRLAYNHNGFSRYGGLLIVGSLILFAYSGAIMLYVIRLSRAAIDGSVD